MRIGTGSGNSSLHRVEEYPVGALSNLVEEVGIDDFVDRAAIDRPFAPTMEHGLGVWAREKIYDADDPYIQEHGIRRAATKKAASRSPGTEITWKESIGILDLGGGTAGTIPLAALDGGYVALYYGFFCSAMLRTRRLSLQSENGPSSFTIPSSAALAKEMPAGSEIEFVGQGRLNMGAGIAVGTGLALGPFWAGVAAVAPTSNEGIKEYSVTVTAVDGNGKMRVVVRRLDSVQTTAGVLGAAGFISPGYNGIGLEEDNSRLLLVGNTSTVRATGMILDMSSASAGLSASHLERSTVISAFEIDLDSADGVASYEDLLRLSPYTAYKAAHDNEAAVKFLTIKEKQTEFATSGYISVFGDKIFSSERFDTERHGEMTRCDGSQLLYRNKIFEKKHTNYFVGNKYVCWESISTKESRQQRTDLFYHLKYEHSDFEFVKHRLGRFLDLGKALFIEPSEMKYSEGQSPQSFQSLVTKAARVDTTFDMYFTSSGVEQIESADVASAQSQYLLAMRFLKSKYSGFPCNEQGIIEQNLDTMLSDYAELSSVRHAFGLGRFREREKLRREYKTITGRSIEQDIKLFKDSQAFAHEVVSSANSRRHGHPEELFSRLGRLKGFHFEGAIVALINMAGRDNFVIQEMSIKSRKEHLTYNENAFFKLPRQMLFEALTQE